MLLEWRRQGREWRCPVDVLVKTVGLLDGNFSSEERLLMAVMTVVMVVFPAIERRQRHLDAARPNHPILDDGSYPRDEQLLHLGHVLQLGARAQERRGREGEVKVRLQGEVHGRVGVSGRVRVGRVGRMGRAGRPDMRWHKMRRDLDRQGPGEPLEADGQRDGQDRESRPRDVQHDPRRDGEDHAVAVVDIELDALWKEFLEVSYGRAADELFCRLTTLSISLPLGRIRASVKTGNASPSSTSSTSIKSKPIMPCACSRPSASAASVLRFNASSKSARAPPSEWDAAR